MLSQPLVENIKLEKLFSLSLLASDVLAKKKENVQFLIGLFLCILLSCTEHHRQQKAVVRHPPRIRKHDSIAQKSIGNVTATKSPAPVGAREIN